MSLEKVKIHYLLYPILIIGSLVIYLLYHNALSAEGYIEIQKNFFIILNNHLSQYPNLQHNITQLGDAFVVFTLLSFLFIIYQKFYATLITTSLVSLMLSKIPKEILDIPRPCTIWNENTFTIIGKPTVGYSSCPSGHSITIFTWVTLLILSFLPKKIIPRTIWLILGSVIGLFFAFSRVAVGAHHPLDVIIGSCLGICAAIVGTIIENKFQLWKWSSHPKWSPVFLVIFTLGVVGILIKIFYEPLPVYFLALTSLIYTLYYLTKKYYAYKMDRQYATD